MNFNHLMENRFNKRRCKAGNDSCYWVPVGNIRSTQGENVHMTMICEKCATREDVFLTKEEFLTQRKLIFKEIGNV